jgi:hypothetical protein
MNGMMAGKEHFDPQTRFTNPFFAHYFARPRAGDATGAEEMRWLPHDDHCVDLAVPGGEALNSLTFPILSLEVDWPGVCS